MPSPPRPEEGDSLKQSNTLSSSVATPSRDDARLVQLPPSPEFRGGLMPSSPNMAPSSFLLPPNSLSPNRTSSPRKQQQQQVPRLCHVAHYPTKEEGTSSILSLACTKDMGAIYHCTSTDHHISLFRLTQPHKPLMHLQFQSRHNNNDDNQKCHLRFAPSSTSSSTNHSDTTATASASTSESDPLLLLAAAHGSSVHIWNVRGGLMQRRQPLWSKLHLDATIDSLAWASPTTVVTSSSRNSASSSTGTGGGAAAAQEEHVVQLWNVANRGTTPSLQFSTSIFHKPTVLPSIPPPVTTTTPVYSNSNSTIQINSSSWLLPNITGTTTNGNNTSPNSPRDASSHTSAITLPSNHNPTVPSMVQVAVQRDSHELGVLHSVSGDLQIYDLGHVSRHRPSIRNHNRALAILPATHSGGAVGLLPLPLSAVGEGSRWLTWGMDPPVVTTAPSTGLLDSPLSTTLLVRAPKHQTMVKIWGQRKPAEPTAKAVEPPVTTTATVSSSLVDSDEYWGHSGSSFATTASGSHTMTQQTQSSSSFELLAFCDPPNLACVRQVEPEGPLSIDDDDDSFRFVVVGHHESGSVYAKVYQCSATPASTSKSKSTSGSSGGAGLRLPNRLVVVTDNDSKKEEKEKATGDESSPMTLVELSHLEAWNPSQDLYTASQDAARLAHALNDSHPGQLVAAEIALCYTNNLPPEVHLCCLSHLGVIASYAVPEALSRGIVSTQRKNSMGVENAPDRAPVFPVLNSGNMEGSISLQDAAGFWGDNTKSSSAFLSSPARARNAARQQQLSPYRPIANISTGHTDAAGAGLSPLLPSLKREGSFGHPVTTTHRGEAMIPPFDLNDTTSSHKLSFGGQHSTLMLSTSPSALAPIGELVLDGLEPSNSNRQHRTTGLIPSAAAISIASSNDDDYEMLSDDEIERATSIIAKIDPERVPCPPLCGAVFCPGAGGLVTFGNGKVRNMWEWYQCTDSYPNKLKNIPSMLGEIPLPEMALDGTPEESAKIQARNVASMARTQSVKNAMMKRTAPRSMKDLLDMMSSAKEAQWGDENDDLGEHDADRALNVGDNCDDEDDFFDDYSTDSQHSLNSAEEHGTETPPHMGEVYSRYFGGRMWKGPVPYTTKSPSSKGSKGTPGSSPNSGRRSLKSFHGPSTDVLTPSVAIHRDKQHKFLSQQSKEFARGWALGGWENMSSEEPLLKLDTNFKVPTPTPVPIINVQASLRQTSIERSVDRSPHYRFLPATPTRTTRIPRTKSESHLTLSRPPINKQGLLFPLDDPGVHGGEYPVRPNRDENIFIMRKMFALHQQDGDPLLSPPDSPLLYRPIASASNRASPKPGSFLSGESVTPLATVLAKVPSMKIPSVGSAGSLAAAIANTGSQSSTHRNRKGIFESTGTQMIPLGVYTLRPNPTDPRQQKQQRQRDLERIRQVCDQNADVCIACSATEKEGVWRLLSSIAAKQLQQQQGGFNGWSQLGGGALGVETVANLLKYYEHLGDFQMLATMCCVLKGSHYRNHHSNRRLKSKHTNLLPEGQDEKYDLYIRRYSDLLYAWGLFNQRAELNKNQFHLKTNRTFSGGNLDEESKVSEHHSLSGDNKSPGFAIMFECSSCGEETDADTNYCRTCRTFPFRCSICDNAVRGLFTVCDLCGHGGHVEHMMSWFASHKECPTGCGCHCILQRPMHPMTKAQEAQVKRVQADAAATLDD